MKSRENRRGFLKNSLQAGAGLGIAGLASCTATKQNDGQCALDVIHQRRSIRAYKSDPVPEADLMKILDAARMAPTAGNQQPWKFLVIREKEMIQQLKTACIERGMERYRKNQSDASQLELRRRELDKYYNNVFSAPVYIAVLIDNQSQYPGYNHHDGPLGAATLLLAARALGYGTVYYTDSVSAETVKEVLNIPDRYQHVCFTPIGVPESWPETPEKKPLEEIVAWGKI